MANEKFTPEFFKKLQRQVMSKIRNTVGQPIKPTRKEMGKYLGIQSRAKYPRSFMYVFDMVQNETTWCKGLDLIGLSDSSRNHFSDIADRYHENHRSIISYQTLKLQETFIDFKDQLGLGIYYAARRAVRDGSGKYWNAHYISQALQSDENGYGVSYFSTWFLISEYKGEGLTAEFFYEGSEPEKYADVIKKLNFRLETIKADTFRLLGFNRNQREVLSCLAYDPSTKGVAEILELSERAIDYHNGNIIKKANEIFPDSDFKFAKDVAQYLHQQGII